MLFAERLSTGAYDCIATPERSDLIFIIFAATLFIALFLLIKKADRKDRPLYGAGIGF